MLKSTDAEVVREWLARALRDGEALGLTRAGLAAACGVSSQAVTGWQKTGRITKSNLERAINYFGHGPRFNSESQPPTALPVRVTLMLLADHLTNFDELTRQAVTPLVDRLVNHPDEASSIATRVERILAAEPLGEYLVKIESEQAREAAERNAAAARARNRKGETLDEGLTPPTVAKHGNRPPKRQ